MARIFQDKFQIPSTRLSRKTGAKDFSNERWAKGHAGHAWEHVLCWRGLRFARRSVRRCLVFAPFAAKQTKRDMHQRERTGGEIAWGEMLGGSGTENAELLARVLHRAAFTQRSFTQRSFTRRIFYAEKLAHRKDFTHRAFYTEKLLHRKGFTHRSFYTEKSLYRVVLAQRSLHTQRLLHREAFYTEQLLHGKAFTRKSLYTQRL